MDVRHDLIAEIESFCRNAGIAESTFGRMAVNDGKFVSRLREGKGLTVSTAERVRQYLAENGQANGDAQPDDFPNQADRTTPETEPGPEPAEDGGDTKTTFRFYDNRQKYLMFVNTCSEKWVVAERAGRPR